MDAYRRVKEGVWEWWSTYTLHISTDKEPEAVSSSHSGDSRSSSSGAAGGNENQPRQPSSDGAASTAPAVAAPAKGKRYRLVPLSETLQRALPAEGKITVLYGGHSCEALLSLPCSETK